VGLNETTTSACTNPAASPSTRLTELKLGSFQALIIGPIHFRPLLRRYAFGLGIACDILSGWQAHRYYSK
jgi:hypothetical protein